jgi:hypothetical protein
MAMQLLKATDEDFQALADIHAAAFKNDTLAKLMAPKGDTPAKLEVSIGTYRVQAKDPSTQFIKAVDPETGEIAGFARWNIYPSGRSEEELSSPKPPRPGNPELNIELRNNMVALLEKTRRETMGQRPHSCMFHLTLPANTLSFHHLPVRYILRRAPLKDAEF